MEESKKVEPGREEDLRSALKKQIRHPYITGQELGSGCEMDRECEEEERLHGEKPSIPAK